MILYTGTFLEFFEFVLFATLFPVLAKAFGVYFSNNDQATLQYLLFLCGFIARPLGALFLLPKKLEYNKRSVLIVSVVGMGFITMFMGCIPVYVSPIYSIACIVILRFLQGIFTGIEYASATVYGYETETTNKNKVAVYMGLMATLGTAAAYITAALCQLESMQEISFWRAAFLLTGFFGLWVGGLRLSRLPKDFMDRKRQQEQQNTPKDLLACFFIVGLSYTPFYYITSFLNIYGVLLQEADPVYSFFYNAGICLFYAMIIYLIMEKNFFSVKNVDKIFLLFAGLLIPLSFIVVSNDFILGTISLIILIILSQIIVCQTLGSIPGYLGNSLRSVAFVQTFAASLLGGGTPLICHKIVEITGYKWMAGAYPSILTIAGLVSFYYLKHKRLKDTH